MTNVSGLRPAVSFPEGPWLLCMGRVWKKRVCNFSLGKEHREEEEVESEGMKYIPVSHAKRKRRLVAAGSSSLSSPVPWQAVTRTCTASSQGMHSKHPPRAHLPRSVPAEL